MVQQQVMLLQVAAEAVVIQLVLAPQVVWVVAQVL
jgi:hypothetical protein